MVAGNGNGRSAGAQKALESFKKRMNRQAILAMASCVHCGRCTETCHYYLALKDPKMAPAYKADQVRKIYKRHYDWLGRVFPGWVKGKDLTTDEELRDLMDVVYGSCTMCRRCTMNCPMGVDKALIMRTMRGILMEQGIAPQGVLAVSKDQWEVGNQMGVSKEDYLETIEWLGEELQNEMGEPTAILPMDKMDANMVFAINPREVKYAPMSLLAAAKIFWAAGENWTMSSEGWDNTNFGLFNGDNALGGHMGKLVFSNVQRLRGRELVCSECGHGFRATKWESPNWAGMDLDFPIRSFLEVMVDYVRDGRIKLDRSRNNVSVTYHDPCNLSRSGGMTEEPRYLLQRAVVDFREMHPNRADNWCCSGGGGAMSMSEYSKRRLEVAKIKAEQLRATGADIVATACHNCVDGLTDLIKYHKVKMQVKLVGELVADALVLEPKAMISVPSLEEVSAGQTILVVDDDPDAVTFLSTFFEDNGFKTVTAADADKAARVLLGTKPDLMTLDIIMPGTNGVDFYRQLKRDERYKDIPVIIVTGVNPNIPGQVDARGVLYGDSGMPAPEGYLDKPVKKELLLMTVKKVFELGKVKKEEVFTAD